MWGLINKRIFTTRSRKCGRYVAQRCELSERKSRVLHSEGAPFAERRERDKERGRKEQHIGFTQEKHSPKPLTGELRTGYQVFTSRGTPILSFWKSAPFIRVKLGRH